ncbi:hypothetical protein PR048_009113 [Dryococelus australis]|uniref:Uncharacterized protein n=1 Tax=Dryococelus australis TaxID=614101 RepID=A0ABQ9I0U4_9NEOP|nr:hypothetical protein PR048_009113 [Dryococelus australis]
MILNHFFIGFLQKVAERSPLAYNFTRCISCINPELIYRSPNIAEQRLKSCLELLVEKQQIPGSVADKVLEEYREFRQISSVTETLKSLRCHNKHLYEFYMQTVLVCGKPFPSLLQFFKHLLILSHGNAANADCLVENQTEEILVAQRVIYNAIIHAGGVENIKITMPGILHQDTRSIWKVKGKRKLY